MTTRIPVTMIAPGTPNVLLGRDAGGVATELPMPGGSRFGRGMHLSKVGATTLTVGAGFRVNGLLATGIFSGLSKDVASMFAPGNNSGSLDVGAIAANTFYYVFVIKNTTTDECDILTSLSATAPTVPADHVVIRRIGSFLINADTEIENFIQSGNYFAYGQSFFDGTITQGQSSQFPVITHKVPNQIQILADVYTHYYNNGVIYGIIEMYPHDAALVSPGANSSGAMRLGLWAIGNFTGSGSGSSNTWRIFLNANNQARHHIRGYEAFGSTITTRFHTLGWVDLEI